MPRTAPNSRLAQAVLPVLSGLAFLAVLGLLTWGVALLASHNSGKGGVQVNLGVDTFNAGPAKNRAQEIDAQGPLLFPGLVNGAERRAIGLYHTGTAELRGWVAYSLVPPGAPSTCVLTLDRAARQLVSPCDARRFAPTGEGLDMFKVNITPDKELEIDLGRGAAAKVP
jgi:hypothetical protein